MYKLCHECRQLIPANVFVAHRQAHKNARKTGPHWDATGRRNRKIALARDHDRCQECGRSRQLLLSLGIQLHVHHRIAKEDGGSDDVDNLLTLCSDCHPRGGTRA